MLGWCSVSTSRAPQFDYRLLRPAAVSALHCIAGHDTVRPTLALCHSPCHCFTTLVPAVGSAHEPQILLVHPGPGSPRPFLLAVQRSGDEGDGAHTLEQRHRVVGGVGTGTSYGPLGPGLVLAVVGQHTARRVAAMDGSCETHSDDPCQN